MNLCNHRSGIGPGGLAMDMGGYGGGGIQDLLGEGTCGVGEFEIRSLASNEFPAS